MAGKKYKKATTGWDPTKKYSVDEACAILPKTKISTKWDETVDVAVRLGVNPKYADQMVRGSSFCASAPTGRTVRTARSRALRESPTPSEDWRPWQA